MGENYKQRTTFRLIRKDGSLNIATQYGVSFKDLYHDLLKCSWSLFALLLAAFYFFLNCFFGFIYFLLPVDGFIGFIHTEGFDRYLECFFFSVQTFGTIGYGKISPISTSANFVVTIESYTSMFVAAVMTGLIFSRFARPSGKIMASQVAVIREYDGIPCLMFRIANARQNYITDARVRVSLAMDDPKTKFRAFYDLKLEMESSPIFALSWTIAHDILPTSPLYGLANKQLCERNAEIVVTFSGMDTTLSQNLHLKFSYISEEILVDHDFVDVIRRNPNGTVELMLENFHLTKPVTKALAYSDLPASDDPV